MYNVDQWKIFKMLGSSLPKRDAFSIGDIKDKSFKQAPNDRVVRNAIRKPVKEGHIEISDRGQYRFTAKGSAFFQKMEKENFKPGPVRAMATPEKKAPKKAAPKAKSEKKAAPKEAKSVKSNAGSANKKVGTKAVEAKSNGNGAKAEPKKSSVKIPRPKTEEPKVEAKTEAKAEAKEGATLSFA